MNVNKALQSALENHKAGNLQQAELIYRNILRKRPNDVDALHLLGVLCHQLGHYDSAIKYIRKALKLDAGFAEAYNNLGNVIRDKGEIDDAETYYQKALQIDPNFAIAYNNLGSIYTEKKLPDKAIFFLKKALEINPNFAEAHCNLGKLLFEIKHLEEAINCLQKAVEINPHYAEAYTNLGIILHEQGKIDESLDALNKAIAANPAYITAHWAKCMSQFPKIYINQTNIEIVRNNYHDELMKLQKIITLDTPKNIAEAAKAVGRQQPFYVAHQGMNVRDLQHMYGNLVNRIMASKYPEFAKRPRMPSISNGERIRVGIISGYFYYHSVWKIPLKGWIENIDKSRFSLYGYYTGLKKDEVTTVAKRYFDRFVEDIWNFESLCEIIRKDNLHILIFPEISQDPVTLKLASLWMAPIQCVSAIGATMTSGLKTIDYSLSSDLMEPMDADNYYTEQLIRLPNLSLYQTSEDIPWTNVKRETFGLRQKSTIYLCSHQLPTHLPQYDDIYPCISQEIGDCQFVFISSRYGSFITDQFRLRLSKTFNRFNLNYKDYIVFLPRLDKQQYRAINCTADIFLDTIDWSACNSAFEAIACNLPIVTLPGKFMRGRHAMGILKMMGLNETIVSTIDEYVELAVRLAKDSKWRRQISEKIVANKHRIYHDRKCIIALENFLESVVKERYEQDSKETN